MLQNFVIREMLLKTCTSEIGGREACGREDTYDSR